MDSLDFYDVAVWSIKDALAQSYRTGLEDQSRAFRPDLNTQIWGHPAEAVAKDLLGLGCTPREVEMAFQSFGILMPPAVSRWYRKKIRYDRNLEPDQIRELEDRISIYQ